MSNISTDTVQEFLSKFSQLKKEIAKTVIGQNETIDQVLISIFCRSHSLLVGVPGLAKTLLIQSISEALDLNFSRIQFTPDLMPSDIIGAETMNAQREFKFVKGPIFANIVLADEINRTPPKTQAALLEAMQEKTVTIAGENHKLEEPFFVLATQNPIEQEGTYPLPEAQLDRFMFNILVEYPSFDEEVEIIKKTTGNEKPKIEAILSSAEILKFQQLVRELPVTDNVYQYAVGLTHKTRIDNEANDVAKEFLDWGAGPRASQNLILAAKCHALINGKLSPDIENVKAIAKPVLRHRIIRNFRAEAEGVEIDDIIGKLL